MADFSGYGEMRKRCVEVELDERPRDCDGVPIEVGDTIWVVSEDGSSVYDCSVVVVNTDGANGLVRVREKPENGWSDFLFPSKLTHREPADSWERIAGDIESAKGWCDQNGDYGTGLVSISEPKLIKWADRIRKLAKKEC